MAYIITVSAHKGGCGKTVTAMNLASALARASKKTLLCDLDPQGHSTLGLGIDLNDEDPSIRELFTDPAVPIAKVIWSTQLSCLHLLPSHIRLARLAPALYARPKREELLKRALGPILSQYEVVLLDCPPSLGVLTEMAIAAADLVIIPCQMEARAADGLVDLLEVISIIKGEHFDQWRVLRTRVDSRKTTTNEVIMNRLKNWEDKILKTVIPQSEPLNQAQIARTDVFAFDGTSKGAVAYGLLANEILELINHGG